MEPKRLAARAAAHLDAIEAARQAGFSWNEIAIRLGVPGGTALRRAVGRAGKYRAEQQMPLPDLPAQPAGTPSSAPPTTPGAVQDKPATPASGNQKRPMNPAEIRKLRESVNTDDYL